MDNPPFAIGDHVWVVHASTHGRKDVPCPVCFGTLVNTLILGNGEHVETECGMCSLGYDGAQGVVGEWCATSSVRAATVTGLSLDGEDWHVSTTEHGGDIFATEAEAEAFRAEAHAKNEKIAERWWQDQQVSKRKGVGWTVGYARTEIRKLRKTLEYHESKIRAGRKNN